MEILFFPHGSRRYKQCTDYRVGGKVGTVGTVGRVLGRQTLVQ